MPKINIENQNKSKCYHFWARAREMPKMSFGIGHWKCPNEFRKPQNEYFKPRRPQEMSEHSFGCPKSDIFELCWAREGLKNSTGSFKINIFGSAPKLGKCRKWVSRDPKWAQGWWPNLKKRAKTHCFRWVLRHGRPPKAPESRLDPQVGSGKAKNEVWEPRNTHKVRVHIQKKARKRVVFAMFCKKRIKAS